MLVSWPCTKITKAVSLHLFTVPKPHEQGQINFWPKSQDSKLKKCIVLFSEISADLSSPDIEGVYETQVPLLFRALVKLGCITMVNRDFAKFMAGRVRYNFACQYILLTLFLAADNLCKQFGPRSELTFCRS